jgi:hypothetical protein
MLLVFCIADATAAALEIHSALAKYTIVNNDAHHIRNDVSTALNLEIPTKNNKNFCRRLRAQCYDAIMIMIFARH